MISGRKGTKEENVSNSSDTDGSSPECDKCKTLSKHFLGKLCCAIANPIDQLQERCLISESLMKHMIMPHAYTTIIVSGCST